MSQPEYKPEWACDTWQYRHHSDFCMDCARKFKEHMKEIKRKQKEFKELREKNESNKNKR